MTRVRITDFGAKYADQIAHQESARVARGNDVATVAIVSGERTEKATHVLICQELNRRGIKYVHAAMNKRSTLPEGHPDFAVYLPCNSSQGRPGCVWFVEVKTATGKLSTAQEAYIADLKREGFYVSVPRSFEEFAAELRQFIDTQHT